MQTQLITSHRFRFSYTMLEVFYLLTWLKFVLNQLGKPLYIITQYVFAMYLLLDCCNAETLG